MVNPNVDLVIVLDCSRSMRPCFDGVRKNLEHLLVPMQGQVGVVRFGLVGHQVRKGVSGGPIYSFDFGDWQEGIVVIENLYDSSLSKKNQEALFFTDSPDKFRDALCRLTADGNEDMLLALDVALDFPFGLIKDTKRAVALFSDEQFETGDSTLDSISGIPLLIDKIHQRHVKLFCAVPEGSSVHKLAQADGSEIEIIDKQGGGLASVNFKNLFEQIGKSISVGALQDEKEDVFEKALFGQDDWQMTDEGYSVLDGDMK